MATMEMQPSSLTSLTDDKLARFVIGRQKKTKFEKVRVMPSSIKLLMAGLRLIAS